MASTILVAGATGNVGRNLVDTLSRLLESNITFSDYKIIALTRSAQGEAAQEFAKLPNVQVIEKNWADVTEEFLRQHQVKRAFIAAHLEPTQFTEESAFMVAALCAGVEYLVRISTAAPNVRPDKKPYYARTHWAIEALLSTPEFESLRWTSLQPGPFAPTYLGDAAAFVKAYRQTGTQGTLELMASKEAVVAIIQPDDIGAVAAHLLIDDPAKHNRAKYVLSGPEDVTGEQIVQLVEEKIGTKVERVNYKSMPFVEQMAQGQKLGNIIRSVQYALDVAWDGELDASTTSPEIAKLGLVKTTPKQAFDLLCS